MGTKYGTGWREREAAGKAKLAERISPALAENLKIAADRLQAEREAAVAFAVEQERRRLETLSVCPTCAGLGRVTVEDAATAIAGTEHYKQRALKPDTRHYAQANAGISARTAVTEPTAFVVVATAPVMVTNDDAPGSDDEALAAIQAEPVKPAKAPRRHVVPPFLEDEA